MFLNNNLPKGLLNLYKTTSEFNKKPPETQQQQQPTIEVQKNETVLPKQIDNSQPTLQPKIINTINNTPVRPSYQDKFKMPMQYNQFANQKKNSRNNPFVKYDEYDEKSCIEQGFQSDQKNGFFEFIEPTVRNFDDQLTEGLQNSFIYMIIGPPKSGKTNLLNKLITSEQFYGSGQKNQSQFDKIIFISPSVLPGFKLREGYNYSSKLDLFTIYNMLSAMDQEYQNSENFKQNHIKGQLLLVFDDCIGEMQEIQRKREFQNLFNNRRQILVSMDIQIIATSQSANGLPAFVRKISTGLFIFQVLGGQEYKILMDENIPKRYKEPFKSVLSEYLKEKYSYIYISKYPFEIYTNFNNQFKQIQMF